MIMLVQSGFRLFAVDLFLLVAQHGFSAAATAVTSFLFAWILWGENSGEKNVV